jgi:SAM-dependent methyltransferase
MNFWDREVVDRQHETWMAPEASRRYINEQVTGDPGVWPVEWLRGVLADAIIPRALSIGCGGGALERSLLEGGICERIDAFDSSVVSLNVAREEASKFPWKSRVRYFAADFNRCNLPRRAYDAVFFHQSFHHVAYIERLFAQVWRTLKPDGLLYMDEYIGPSRFEWAESRMRRFRDVYRGIEPESRKFAELPRPIAPGDPTEAVRSSDIMRYLRLGFEIEIYRPYGGAILSTIFPNVNWARTDEPVLYRLIEEDRAFSRDVAHYHAVVLARPKRLPLAALLRYRTDSKLRRLKHEIQHLFGFRGGYVE